MTKEELEHLHSRLDYLMGQVETISKTDAMAALDRAAERVGRALEKFSALEARLNGIERTLRALTDVREQRRATYALRKERREASVRRKEANVPSVWEMLHEGSA